MTLSRDSALWTFGIMSSWLTYLLAAPPPSVWTYHQWLQAIAFAVVTVSGKLGSSPLKSAAEQNAVSLPKG